MKEFVLILVSLLSLSTLYAQEETKAKKGEVSVQSEDAKLEIAAIVGAIVSNPEHQKLRKEMQGSSSYIPINYLNIRGKGFDKPNYSGIWEQDIILFKTAIAKWKQKFPDSFQSYLKEIGIE